MKKQTKKTETANVVTLLPQGAFLITVPTKDGTATEQIKGRFDMMAIETFANALNMPGIYMLSDKIRIGMLPGEYADFILCGIHRIVPAEHCEFKKDDVLRWFEVMGGFTSHDFGKLILQAIRLFVPIETAAATMELTDDEKKILGIRTAGKISGSKQSKQG